MNMYIRTAIPPFVLMVILSSLSMGAGEKTGSENMKTDVSAQQPGVMPDLSFLDDCAFISVDIQPLQRNYMTQESMPESWRQAGWKAEDFNEATDYKFDVAFPNARKVADACRSIGLPMIFVHWGHQFIDGMDLAPDIRKFNIDVHGPDYRRWPNRIGDPSARPAEFLGVRAGEYVIAKTDHDAFTSSNINNVLQNLGVKNVILIGGHTDACLGKTSISAKKFGYQTLCVEDATFAGMMSLWRKGLSESQYNYIINTQQFIEMIGDYAKQHPEKKPSRDTMIPPDVPLAPAVYGEQALNLSRPAAIEFWAQAPTHHGYPWNIIRMWFPEAGHVNGADGKEIWNIHASRDPATWEYVEGGLRAECDIPAGGKFIRTVERNGPTLHLTMTFQNDSQNDWSHAEGGSCLQMSAAFDYEDNTGERTYWVIDGKLTPTFHTALTDAGMRGHCGVGEAIPMKDGSKKTVNEGAAFIVSKDGKYVLGYSWQPALGMFYNRAGIVACVHVQPQPLTVPAGESRSVKGIVFIHDGSLEDAYKKFLSWKKQLGQ